MEVIRCERCREKLNPDTAVWLELSNTDGNYYKEIPSDHVSQGGFSFGAACAKSQLEETAAKTVQTEPKFFFCQFGYGKGLVLYGAQFLPNGNVRMWLSDNKGRVADDRHTINVVALKNMYNEVLPLSVQLTKYKGCAVVAEHSSLTV